MALSLALILISVFLALNMGVSGFSVAFTPSYGSHILKKSKAVFFYGFWVFVGALLVGPRVVETLAKNIVLQQIGPLSGLLVLLSAATMMFLSNLLKIPQSTSFVTVASFVGMGLYYGQINWATLLKIVLVALGFSIFSFISTWFLKRKLYPPAQNNLRFYEIFHINRDKFKKFIVWTDMYSAFGIGTNNVANVVAPMVGSVFINPFLALALAAPFFGLGAYIFGERVIKTVSREIVPIGEISATIISLITATLVIIASLFGLPTPYVQFATFSVLAVSCIKDGIKHTLGKSVVKKIISVWMLVPLLTALLSLILHSIFIQK